jgi:hypothetical protein
MYDLPGGASRRSLTRPHGGASYSRCPLCNGQSWPGCSSACSPKPARPAATTTIRRTTNGHRDRNPAVSAGPPLATGSLDVAPFDRDALIGALRADQAGMTTLAEFLGAAWRAGVLRYVADFDAREVTYYGWNGDSYVESYPDAAIEQP